MAARYRWHSEMIEKLKNWLQERFFSVDTLPPVAPRRTSSSPAPRLEKPAKSEPAAQQIEAEPPLSGKIEDAGPGKSVLIRNKYLREDTGTHETLKILDDSLLDSDEETGIDPYNTGNFDRSKNWHNRFRK